MTAPQIIKRTLTFRFDQSVSATTGLPDVMEVALLPLDNPSSGMAGGTFAGGLKTAEVVLNQAINLAAFDLIPSNSAGLTTPINYRVMWRTGVQGKTFSFDFMMPDEDIYWDEIASLGGIIDGQSYLQQSDLGVPGRVARLDSSGHVIDSAGNLVATGGDVTTLTGLINTERVQRQQADVLVQTTLESELSAQVTSTLSTARSYTDNQVTSVNSDLSTERSSRQNADADLQTQINTNSDDLQDQIDSLSASTGGNTSALSSKADLDNTGHVPVAQIPDAILTNAFPVADQTAMLALSSTIAHKGSLAVRPDGVFLLTSNDPSTLANWVGLSTISSVNNKRGAVTLTAADVGAIATGGSIALSQVTGLNTALGTKANASDLATTNTSLAALQNDATLVRTSGGVIPYTLLDSHMVYLNDVGQLVKKDGTIIPVSGGGGAVFSVNTKTGTVVLTAADVGAIPAGASITQGQVTGLTAALSAKADLDGSSLVPVAQIPSLAITKITGLSTALANKADLSGGLIPVGQVPVLPITQITGLSALIGGNQLTSGTNAINRVASLEGRMTAVESGGGGGGGGGGGTTSTTVFYDSSNVSTPVIDFTQVSLHSPWGIDSDGSITGTTNSWYYLHTGVRSTDVAYPFISPNGHLNLRKWNESGAADPVYALQSDLATLTTTVGTKAAQSDLTALTNVVATKASQTSVTTLSTTVDGKANIVDLNSTNTAVATKANISDLTTTNNAVATKANQADLATLSTVVSGKADATALTSLTGRVTTAETTLTTKADLSGGVLATGQIPNVPQNKVTNLTSALAAKADLTAGVLATAQIPNVPQANVTGLTAALTAKADLVSGYVPVNQIPPAALPNFSLVANRAALLALTTSQVQYGDLGLITATSDKGSYILGGSADPSVWSNWTPFALPDAPVLSVNNQTGVVVLAAADVGALAATASIPISQIFGLSSQLATFATTTALTSGLAGKTSPSDIQTMFYNSSMVKKADYVSTTAISTLAGQQSVDSVLVPLGATVLTTAQSSSVNNGLWIVNSGSWSRPADFATGSFLAKDTIVIVSNTTAGAQGSANPYTIWQMTGTSGFIDTSSNNWTRIGYAAPAFSPTAGNGINVSGSVFSAKVDTGKGVVVTSSGLATDPNVVPGKFLGTVPSGSTVAGITHNLNSTSPVVQIWEVASNTMVLAGVTVVTANSISIEFASAPASGQYRVVVLA